MSVTYKEYIQYPIESTYNTDTGRNFGERRIKKSLWQNYIMLVKKYKYVLTNFTFSQIYRSARGPTERFSSQFSKLQKASHLQILPRWNRYVPISYCIAKIMEA